MQRPAYKVWNQTAENEPHVKGDDYGSIACPASCGLTAHLQLAVADNLTGEIDPGCIISTNQAACRMWLPMLFTELYVLLFIEFNRPRMDFAGDIGQHVW